MPSFSAQIDRFKANTLAKMKAVMQESIQDVCDDMQTPKAKGGRMPVDTGYLRNSLASGLNGAFGAVGPDSYVLTIQGMEPGDTSRFAYTADYARRMEMGFTGTDARGRKINQQGNHFMQTAAARFSEHVTRNTGRLK